MNDDMNELIKQRDALNAKIEAGIKSAQKARDLALFDLDETLREFADRHGLSLEERRRKNWTYFMLAGQVEVGHVAIASDRDQIPREPFALVLRTPDGGVQYSADFSDIPPPEHLLGLLNAILSKGS